MSEVVKEGFTEKVGFEHHLISIEFQKGGRRGESMAAKTEQTGRTGGNTNDVQETGISFVRPVRGAQGGRGSEAGARLGGNQCQDLFLKLWSLEYRRSIKLEMWIFHGFPVSSRHFFTDQFENDCCYR